MPDDNSLVAGKLPGPILERLIRTYVKPDPRVLIGPEVGADAAAIDIQSPVIVVKSDPVTFPTPDIARYLVNVNANDIVCMGGRPRWLLVTALLPDEGVMESDAESMFRDLSEACETLEISLVGGHTEITASVRYPIMVGTLIGDAIESDLLDLRRSKPGDILLLCNSVAIEGTSILASEARSDQLAAIDSAILERSRALIDDPGISVIPAARALSASGAEIRGMHDPTEGGIATAIWEVSRITNCSIKLTSEIPLLQETRAICDVLDLDPLGLIASGALLATVAPHSAPGAISALESAGIEVTELGRLHQPSRQDPEVFMANGQLMPTFATDEIARYFTNQ